VAVLATFNVGDLSPSVEDCFEDPSDLRSNLFEEWEVDAGHKTQERSQDQNHVYYIIQGQEDQGNQITLSQIHSLFSCFKPELNTILDGMILGVSKSSYRHVLLRWTP